MKTASADFPRLVQDFFGQRLIQQGNSSPQTVAAYRDAFRLLLRFLAERLAKSPTDMVLADLSARNILAFLDHQERVRGNSIRTRNARLAALRSFLKYVMLEEPSALPEIQKVMAIPMKRFEKALVGFLSRQETETILQSPSPSTWSGRRDRALLATLYNTGARVSEIVAIRVNDLDLDGARTVHLLGKGRKQRAVPLWRRTVLHLRGWIRENRFAEDGVLFPNAGGGPLTRSGVAKRLTKAVAAAQKTCPSLKDRHVSPHVLRHTTAMHLLQAGVDMTVIALWLGHESPSTTHIYVTTDMKMKEKALHTIQPPATRQPRYRPKDGLLAFLEGL
jgi:site-specific recombinase XerD